MKRYLKYYQTHLSPQLIKLTAVSILFYVLVVLGVESFDILSKL